MNGNKYSVSIKTPVEAPPEYAAHQLEAGRRQAGNELYKILYSQKLPAVVDIEEISIPAPQGDMYSMYRPEHELRIEITVTPVQYRHVVLPSFYSESAQHSVQRTAGTWRKFLNFVGRVAGSFRRR